MPTNSVSFLYIYVLFTLSGEQKSNISLLLLASSSRCSPSLPLPLSLLNYSLLSPILPLLELPLPAPSTGFRLRCSSVVTDINYACIIGALIETAEDMALATEAKALDALDASIASLSMEVKELQETVQHHAAAIVAQASTKAQIRNSVAEILQSLHRIERKQSRQPISWPLTPSPVAASPSTTVYPPPPLS